MKVTFFSIILKAGGLFIFSGFLMGACRETAPALSEPPTLQAAIPTLSPEPKLEVPTLKPTELRPEPTQQPKQSVVLVSWDAARLDWIENWMAEGLLPHFSQVAETGLRANFVTTIDPSLTAAAHASLATGLYPSRTGLVSNAFHNANDSFYWYRSGFEEPYVGGEPIWVTASRNGLKTAAVAFPGATPDLPGQMADLTVAYGERLAYSDQVKVKLAPMDEPSEEGRVSYSLPLEGDFQIARVGRVSLVVVDTTDDGREGYDRVVFHNQVIDTEFADGKEGLGVGDWGHVIILEKPLTGADILVQDITDQEVTLFHSAVYRNKAAPQALLEAIDDQFGYFAPSPDSYGLEHGWIGPEEYLQMLERAALWRAQVGAWIYRFHQPDLLLVWQEPFDSAGHAFALFDPLQEAYTPEKSLQYQEYFQRAVQAADHALAEILAVIDPQRTTIVLSGDHGMVPIHTEVFVNTLLENAGLLVLDNRDYVVVSKSQAFAVASGGAAFIYINLEDREQYGIVSPDDYEEVLGRIVELFRSETDPRTGAPVFQRVMVKTELGEIGLDHSNSGDIFVQANPGYSLNGWRGEADTFQPASYYGQHGYAADLPEMHTIFFAAGGCLDPRPVPLPEMHLVDLVPTIADWLGIPEHQEWQGQVVAVCP